MSVEYDHELTRRYGSVLRHVDRIPRSVTEIYERWAAIDNPKSLTRRRRNERRWLAKALEFMSREGAVRRGEIREGERTYIAFWRDSVDPADAAPADPGVSGAHGEVRGGLGQPQR